MNRQLTKSDHRFWRWARNCIEPIYQLHWATSVDDRSDYQSGCYQLESLRDNRGNFEHWRNGSPFIANPQELWQENALFREPYIYPVKPR